MNRIDVIVMLKKITYILTDEFSVESCNYRDSARFLDIVIVHRITNWKFSFTIPAWLANAMPERCNNSEEVFAHLIAANLSANFMLYFPDWGQNAGEDGVELQSLNADEELGEPAWVTDKHFQPKPQMSNIKIAMQLGRFSNAEKLRILRDYSLLLHSSGT